MELIPSWIYDDLQRIRGLRNIFAHRYDSADFDDADVMLFPTKLEGANYAVVAIEKKENAIEPPTYNEQEPTEGCLGERTRKALKKERLRFILTSSYIGGWLESEVKIRALKKEILESKIRIESLKKETEGLETEKQDLESEVSDLRFR